MALKKLTICLLFLLLVSSCHSPYKVEEPANNSITEVAAVIKTKEQAEIVSNYRLQNALNYVIVGSLAAIGVCSVLFLLKGSVGGITGSIAAGVVLVLAITIKAYMAILALVGLILLCALIVLLAIYLLRDKRAFAEVVQTVERAKEQIPTDIGLLSLKVSANALQHESTREAVRKVKGEVKKEGAE